MVGDYTSKMLKLLVFIFDGTLEPVFAVQIQNDTTLIKAMVALREIRLYHKRKKWFIRTHLQQRRVIVAEMVIGSLPEIRMWFGHNLNSILRNRAAFRLPCPFQVVYIKFHFHSSKSIGLAFSQLRPMLFYARIMPARMAMTIMVLTCHIAAGCPLSASSPLSRLSVCTACMWDVHHHDG